MVFLLAIKVLWSGAHLHLPDSVTCKAGRNLSLISAVTCPACTHHLCTVKTLVLPIQLCSSRGTAIKKEIYGGGSGGGGDDGGGGGCGGEVHCYKLSHQTIKLFI